MRLRFVDEIGAALRLASSIAVISSIFYEKIKIYIATVIKTLTLKVSKKDIRKLFLIKCKNV